ncbi:MAG: antibiotic biosynthesis monooxygenase [Muribaculum sp.]|nr:antibiotic biosynthesis monooxygenase [Muribaculum sp.]
MIRLNASILIEEAEKRKPLIEAAKELVAYSLHDKGCIDYDLYASVTNDDRLIIIETWENERDLKAHQESDHFKRLVPKLKELGTMTTERFDF